jgi:uncharacterized membrane protein (TIGR02234 family)
MAEETSARRSFLPVVVAGLATSGLTAIAAVKPWFQAAVAYKLMPGIREPETTADMPLALALGLVVLAAWGAVLVTRAAVRRFVAAIGVLAALGVVACTVAAPLQLPDDLRAQLAGAGAVPVGPTAWYAVAVVGAVLSLAAVALACWLAPAWPAMGSRYDAPGARRTPEEVHPDDPRAAWKALDEGRDPTDPGEHPAP